jgi:hypothetical protein
MIKEFVDCFIENKSELLSRFEQTIPSNYSDIVKATIQLIYDKLKDNEDLYIPDPFRITKLGFEDSGNNLYIIGDHDSYFPTVYWYVQIEYGSCSGCDTLEKLQVTDSENYEAYWTLALHIVQGLKPLSEDIVDFKL